MAAEDVQSLKRRQKFVIFISRFLMAADLKADVSLFRLKGSCPFFISALLLLFR